MTAPCIYALTDPSTGEVRYIGKANDPSARLKSHLMDSRRRNTPVYRWIGIRRAKLPRAKGAAS